MLSHGARYSGENDEITVARFGTHGWVHRDHGIGIDIGDARKFPADAHDQNPTGNGRRGWKRNRCEPCGRAIMSGQEKLFLYR